MEEVIGKKASKEVILLSLYFGIGFFEVIAEYFNAITFMYLLKSLLMPILAVSYWIKSEQKDNHFMLALFFVFLANVFFISKDFNSIIIASVFLLIHRGLVIYIVIKNVKVKSFLPVFLGCIPFWAVFVYLAFLTMNELGKGFYIYIVQVIFLSFFGGYAISNYIIENSKKNFWLLVNAVLFAIIQFILVLKLFYLSINIFQPISMALYVVAQYGLYKFMLLTEEEKIIK
ncbi:MAG: lysoplasmalogenase family protein [Bacteroidota bacterium]